MDGLAMLVQDVLKKDSFLGDLFAFRGEKTSMLKILFWDGNGSWPSRRARTAIWTNWRTGGRISERTVIDSKGTSVGKIVGSATFDLQGHKLYALEGSTFTSFLAS